MQALSLSVFGRRSYSSTAPPTSFKFSSSLPKHLLSPSFNLYQSELCQFFHLVFDFSLFYFVEGVASTERPVHHCHWASGIQCQWEVRVSWTDQRERRRWLASSRGPRLQRALRSTSRQAARDRPERFWRVQEDLVDLAVNVFTGCTSSQHSRCGEEDGWRYVHMYLSLTAAAVLACRCLCGFVHVCVCVPCACVYVCVYVCVQEHTCTLCMPYTVHSVTFFPKLCLILKNRFLVRSSSNFQERLIFFNSIRYAPIYSWGVYF